MGDIFLILCNRGITAGWFILAVACFELAFRKSPKWANCLLWGVVAIRLVCPFSMESRFCMLPSAEPIQSSAVVEGKVQHNIPSIDSRLAIVKNTVNPMLAQTFAYNESESAAPLQVAACAAGVVWACGMILLLMYAAVSMIRLRIMVREAVCARGNIYICDAVTSPFILGIARPRIYLPSVLNEKEMNYIIAHESAHLKRKDHWWKALGYALLCVYWFHPLCWMAYFLFCKDIELACDEKVAGNLTFHEKKEYSGVLLSCARPRRLVMACPLAFGEVGVKERVQSVLRYKKPALWIVAAAAAACAVFAICFLTNPIDESKDVHASARNVDVRMASSVREKENILPAENALGKEGAPVSLQAGNVPAKSDAAQDIMLYEQPEADKICIEVKPSMISKKLSYYYIPAGKDQEWLAGQVAALDLEGKPHERRWEGHKETGWQIVYNDITINAFEGGYLYYSYVDEAQNEMMECLIEAPKLCDSIQIMLMEKIGYQNYDAADIKDIVSAKLDIDSIFTGWQSYSQTITDADILKTFEEWFRNAKYIYGGADCGNESACLELALANGDIVKLSMATDSCPNFSIDGVAYDYRPASDWDNREFYKYFDEIPQEWD